MTPVGFVAVGVALRSAQCSLSPGGSDTADRIDLNRTGEVEPQVLRRVSSRPWMRSFGCELSDVRLA